MHIEWLQLIFSYTFLVVGEILFLSALLHMVYQRRTPTSMIAWLLAIILLPHLAVPLYFILGSRKRASSKTKSMFSLRSVTDLPLAEANPIDGVLRGNGIPGGTRGNRFALYTDGTSAYTALMREIENARESIFISTYVFNNDDGDRRNPPGLDPEGTGRGKDQPSPRFAGLISSLLFPAPLQKTAAGRGHRSLSSCPSCKCRFATISTCATTERSTFLTAALS